MEDLIAELLVFASIALLTYRQNRQQNLNQEQVKKSKQRTRILIEHLIDTQKSLIDVSKRQSEMELKQSSSGQNSDKDSFIEQPKELQRE